MIRQALKPSAPNKYMLENQTFGVCYHRTVQTTIVHARVLAKLRENYRELLVRAFITVTL